MVYIFSGIKFPDGLARNVIVTRAFTRDAAKTKFKDFIWREFGCYNEDMKKNPTPNQILANKTFKKFSKKEPDKVLLNYESEAFAV